MLKSSDFSKVKVGMRMALAVPYATYFGRVAAIRTIQAINPHNPKDVQPSIILTMYPDRVITSYPFADKAVVGRDIDPMGTMIEVGEHSDYHSMTEAEYFSAADPEPCSRCDGSGVAGHGGLLASEAECGKCAGTGERKRA